MLKMFPNKDWKRVMHLKCLLTRQVPLTNVRTVVDLAPSAQLLSSTKLKICQTVTKPVRKAADTENCVLFVCSLCRRPVWTHSAACSRAGLVVNTKKTEVLSSVVTRLAYMYTPSPLQSTGETYPRQRSLHT